MHELQYLIFTVIILALLFDFINGFHDTANAIATSVSTRAIPPRVAILMAAFLNFSGIKAGMGEHRFLSFESENEELVRKYFTLVRKTYNIKVK